MFAKLSALVGGGPSFPYKLGEQYPTAWGVWCHHAAVRNEDNSSVSVFRASATDLNDPKLVLARNGVKRLRTLRHPNVLTYKDSAEVQEQGSHVVYLVTEPVKPLDVVLDELDLEQQNKDEYLAMGMLHITKAVSFLNNDCKMIHGNLCAAAVVVTGSLDWKLHGFDLLSEHALAGEFPLQAHTWVVPNTYKPAELGKGDWETIRRSPPWAVDSWGLGCLMQEVFSNTPFTEMEQLRNTGVIPKALLGDYQKLLASAPPRRLNPSKVAESSFLNNRLVEVVSFLEGIALKDEVDKESFFRRLPNSLPSFPPAVATGKILPLLTASLEFGGAPPSAISSVLLIGRGLDTDAFSARVVPCLSKMFASPDRTLRKNLLESLNTYCQHLSQAIVEEQIYPHLQTGFADTVPYIRELTLKSLLLLAPKMTAKTLQQSVLKHLSKLQVDEQAPIRANTTVLLGSIAPYLGEATCKRVLLNAFSRALKDAFPPARIAALKALVATMQYYSIEDAAARVLPAVAPSLVDSVADVRQAALQCVDAFLKVLREWDEGQLRGEGGPAASMSAGGPAHDAGSASAVPGASSVLNWAVSSLLPTGASKAAPSKPPPSTQPPSASSPISRRTPPSSSTSAPAPAPAAAPLPTTSKPAEAWGDGGDGWGDADEDLLAMEEEESAAEAAARARLAALSAPAPSAPAPSTRPSPSSASTVQHLRPPPTPSTGWDEAEEDAEEWGSMDSPAGAPQLPPRPAPKAATRPRPTASRATRGEGGGSGAAAGKKLGAMKLGAQKLGAKKAPAAAVDFDTDNW